MFVYMSPLERSFLLMKHIHLHHLHSISWLLEGKDESEFMCPAM
jgi:hypothetical protein